MEDLEKIEVGEVVLFQAYEDHEPIKGRVKRIGSLSELGKMQLDPDDERIFYELESVGERHNFVFTVTTERWIFKIKQDE
jgi:hypothetical protein